MTLDDARPREDAALVEATHRGDQAAFSELFERHRHAVERLASIVTEGDAAETLVSATFIEGLGRVLDGGATVAAFRPWLLQVVLDCHGSAPPLTTAAAAFWSLPREHQELLWHAVVEAESDHALPPPRVGEQLRTEFLRRQREDSAEVHSRTHLDDIAGRADSCATCLGLWWSAEEIATAPALARTLLGAAGSRYLRQTPAGPKTPRTRSRWVPAAAVTFAAVALLTTSIGALAVAQWGPGSVPLAWRTLDPVPQAAPQDPAPTTPAPPAATPMPTPSETPRPSDAPKPSSTPPTSAPTPEPTASPAPSPSDPQLPGRMAVSFDFGDPEDERITRDGVSYEARRMTFNVAGAPAAGAHERTVTMRFEFLESFTYLGSDDPLSCTPTGDAVTCAASLAPGEKRSFAIVVEDDLGEGTARLWSSDDPEAVISRGFDFAPWAGPESESTPTPDPTESPTSDPAP